MNILIYRYFSKCAPLSTPPADVRSASLGGNGVAGFCPTTAGRDKRSSNWVQTKGAGRPGR